MAIPCPTLSRTQPLVVGSAADAQDLLSCGDKGLQAVCDIVEVRLDLLDRPAERPWQHLTSLPLLFTARRTEEGGARGLSAHQRMELLRAVIHEAALIDVEVASITEMRPLLDELKQSRIPWIASFHDFQKLPDNAVMREAAATALDAGAQAFKLAAQLGNEDELERLIEFQKKDHGLPTATMGMGTLAAQSRVRCAQAGSVLNYGYLGDTPTAPGQMSAAQLKAAINQPG